MPSNSQEQVLVAAMRVLAFLGLVVTSDAFVGPAPGRARPSAAAPPARVGRRALPAWATPPTRGDGFKPWTARPSIPGEPKRKRRPALRSIATRQNLATLTRVGLPAIGATLIGFLYFDNLALYVREQFLDQGAIQFLTTDNDFIPNFLTVGGLLFSILAGNAYSSLYQQQEAIYFALFQEVSEAKSLLEQATLVCQGRPFYRLVLERMRWYVKNDLRRLDQPPADLLSSQPSEDPLEAIMYMTSVGVPSVVYETVRNLRQARGYRLGATQRKFPALGIVLL